MQCPHDSATLVMSERAGVEIDYCPECRGVWLDRGELDKILDRAEREQGSSFQERSAPHSSSRDRDQHSRDSYRPKKKEHWLGELFG